MDDILWREWESVKHRGKTHGEICGTSSQKGWDMGHVGRIDGQRNIEKYGKQMGMHMAT